MVFPAGFCCWDIEIWDIGFWDIGLLAKFSLKIKKWSFRRSISGSFWTPRRIEREKFSPSEGKQAKGQKFFGRERLRKYSLSIGYYYDSIRIGKPEPGGLPSDLFGGATPPDERKEGDANECYIFGLDPVVDFHCCSCWSLLWDFQGKEIAATTAIVTACRF